MAKTREQGWFYRGEVAGFLGISTTLVDRDIRPGLPPGSEKMVGRRPVLYGPAVLELRIKQRAAAGGQGGSGSAGLVGRSYEDPLLDSPNASPAQERYRDEKAKIARLQRLKMEEQLVDRGQVREAHGRMAAVLRQAGERLQRRCGAIALEILDEALADWERQVVDAFGEGQ